MSGLAMAGPTRAVDLSNYPLEPRFELPPQVATAPVPLRWMAASFGQVNAVRLLLAAGAKPDARHPEKMTTSLDVARARHDDTILSLLETKLTR